MGKICVAQTSTCGSLPWKKGSSYKPGQKVGARTNLLIPQYAHAFYLSMGRVAKTQFLSNLC